MGEIALRPGWPSMFRGYLGDAERSRVALDVARIVVGSSPHLRFELAF